MTAFPERDYNVINALSWFVSAQRIRKLMKHHNKLGLGEFTRGGKNEGTSQEEQSKALLKGHV